MENELDWPLLSVRAHHPPLGMHTAAERKGLAGQGLADIYHADLFLVLWLGRKLIVSTKPDRQGALKVNLGAGTQTRLWEGEGGGRTSLVFDVLL